MAKTPIDNADTYSLILSDGSLQEVDSTEGGGAGGEVTVSNFPATQPVSGTFWQTTQPVSGTVTVTGIATAGSTQQGAIANAAYTDATGAASGTMIALLKGLYVQNAAIIALLTQIETNTAAP